MIVQLVQRSCLFNNSRPVMKLGLCSLKIVSRNIMCASSKANKMMSFAFFCCFYASLAWIDLDVPIVVLES